MAGQDRAISVLRLFTLERPDWTVEEVAAARGVSASSAYRYVAVLVDAGLLTTASAGHYVLGPAMIQYDRQIQLTDPLLQAARPVMAELFAAAPAGCVLLLCRSFRDAVLCIHQEAAELGRAMVSYERGRPMPLFRGATSKIILAHLPPRDLRRLHATHAAEITAAALGESWAAFRTRLGQLRKAGHVVSIAEIDPGRIGIAAPVLDDGRRILGSLSAVVALEDAACVPALAAQLQTAARAIEAAMKPASGAIL